MVTFQTVECPRCGNQIAITRGATAIHLSCRNKPGGGRSPAYVAVSTVGEGGQSGPAVGAPQTRRAV